MNNDIAFDFDVDTTRLKRAFEATDDIGSVIRIHYELERCLAHVMAKFFKNPKKLDANRAGPRLKRLEAIGFAGPEIQLANEINSIRDGFAHRDKEELAESDLNSLDRLFQLASGHPLAVFKMDLWGQPLVFESMSPRQKFSLYGAACIGMLASLPHRRG